MFAVIYVTSCVNIKQVIYVRQQIYIYIYINADAQNTLIKLSAYVSSSKSLPKKGNNEFLVTLLPEKV